MARDFNNQHTATYGGFVHDFGYVTFSGTGTTLEVDTVLSRINGADFTGANTSVDAESFFLDEPLVNGGVVVDADGQVTAGRVVETGGSITSGGSVYYHFIGID